MVLTFAALSLVLRRREWPAHACKTTDPDRGPRGNDCSSGLAVEIHIEGRFLTTESELGSIHESCGASAICGAEITEQPRRRSRRAGGTIGACRSADRVWRIVAASRRTEWRSTAIARRDPQGDRCGAARDRPEPRAMDAAGRDDAVEAVYRDRVPARRLGRADLHTHLLRGWLHRDNLVSVVDGRVTDDPHDPRVKGDQRVARLEDRVGCRDHVVGTTRQQLDPVSPGF